MQARTILFVLSAVALIQFAAQLALQWGVDPSLLFRPVDVRNVASDWDYRFGYGVCGASFPLVEATMFVRISQELRSEPISLRPLFMTFALGNVLFCVLSLGYSATGPVLLDLPALVLLGIAMSAPRGGYPSTRQVARCVGASPALQQPCAESMS